MTVPSTIRKAGPYNGNDVATSFAFSFKVFTSADIAVTMADVDGTETLLVLDSDYSVTLNGDQDASPGGSITYPVSGTPLATGEALVIVGDLDYGQDYDVPTGGNFNPTAMEDALDKQAMRTQQLLEINDRSMTLAVTSAAGVSTSLPVPVAGRFIGWNGTADALINFAGTAGVAVSAFMETVVATASAALARAALGFTAVGDALAIAADAAAARAAIGAAALASPALTGTPTAPTAAATTSTTQIATTAFVQQEVPAASTTAAGKAELATTAETKTGTDGARAVTPAGLKGALLFSNGFESSDQTVTSNSKLTVAHGLGAKPKLYQVFLKCSTAEANYTAGDEIEYTNMDVAGVYLCSTSADATNLYLNHSGAIRVHDKNTVGTNVTITTTNWRWVFRAWA